MSQSLWATALLTLFFTAALEARSLQVPDAAQPVPVHVITDGPTAFRERGCAQCHQIRGAGGHKGPDLSGVGRRLKKDAIAHQIVDGSDAMPSFGEVLPPAEIEVLVKYLQHCRDKELRRGVPEQKQSPAAPPARPPANNDGDPGL